MPDYSKTMIYQIVYETTCYYVGATTNFRTRKSKHKSSCNDKNAEQHNLKIYTYMRANGWTGSFEKRGWDMILIEPYPCKNLIESSIREFHHYSLLNPSLNNNVPSRTNKEYYKDNKDYYKERNTINNPINNQINNKIKKNCPHCEKEYFNTSLYQHVKTCKKRPTEPNDCIQVVSQVSEPLTQP